MRRVMIALAFFLVGLMVSCKSTETQQRSAGSQVAERKADRVILIIVDGLAHGTFSRLDTPVLNQLIKGGVFYEKLVLPPASHPQPKVTDPNASNYYPFSCSLPNVVQMTGTVFVGRKDIYDRMFQNRLSAAGMKSAFIVNCGAYKDIGQGYDFYDHVMVQPLELFESDIVTKSATNHIEKHDPSFLRVHYQNTGSAGHEDHKNGVLIWDDGSRYREELAEVDSEIGRLVHWLKHKKLLRDTVIMIAGDHGQADEGKHPVSDPKAALSHLIVYGKNIKAGLTVPYTEMTDIVVTAAYLLGLSEKPSGDGRVLAEVLKGTADEPFAPSFMERLNHTFYEFDELSEDKRKKALDKNFLTVDEITSWHKYFENPSIEALYHHNKKVLESLH